MTYGNQFPAPGQQAQGGPQKKGNPMKEFFYGKTYTLQGRIFFPNLLTPVQSQTGMKYDVLFVWPFACDPKTLESTQGMGALFAEAKGLFWPNIPDTHFNAPVKKWGVYQRRDGRPNSDFCKDSWWLNAKSGADYPPVMSMVRNGQMIAIGPQDKAEVYSGRNALINVSFYPNDGQNKGIGCNVNAVVLLDGGERLEQGPPPVDINQAFGSFMGAMNLNAPAQGQPQQAPQQYPAQGQDQFQQAPQQFQQPAQYPAQGQPQQGQQFQPQQAPQQYPAQGQPQQPAQEPQPGQFNNPASTNGSYV